MNIEKYSFFLEVFNNIFDDYNNMNNIKMMEIMESERPRERLVKYGPSSLSNEEILAIVLKTGCKEYSVMDLSKIILKNYNNIEDLRNIKINTLIKIKGVGRVKAISLIAALELGKRVYYEKEKVNVILNNSSKIYDYFKDLVINEKQENFYAIYLDSKSKLISYKLLFKGTINYSCVHPREVFKYAVLESAYSIIIFHNHPSGDVTPSFEDKKTTKVLQEAGNIIGIPVVDHLIFGNNKYYSFYEELHKSLD